VVFVLLCIVNSAALAIPAITPSFALLKAPLVEASTWGLLIAIGALGLGTSPAALAQFGWRHAATVLATTVIVFAIVTGGLLAFQQV
jgi:uncharacterized membrane protein YadS